MRSPLVQVQDPRRQAVGVQAQPQDVDRWFEELSGDAPDEDVDSTVGGDESPVAVDDKCGIGLVSAQHLIDRVPHRSHLGRVELALRKHRGVPGRKEQVVAVAQGHLELFGEVEHHRGARARATGLDEAQMARRDA